jgi:uncharacterized protein YcfJ
MNILMRSMLLGCALAAIAAPAFADPPDWAPAHGWRDHHENDGPRYVWARVERVTPIYARSGYPVRREVCEQQPGYVVSQDRYQQGSGSTAGTLLGAVIGGALGNQVGHGDGRAATTIAGAVIGGAIGNNVTRGPGYYSEQQSYQPGYQNCQVQQGWRAREQVVGYDVIYRWHGNDFQTRTRYAPGERIRMRVDQVARPSGDGYGGGYRGGGDDH